VIGIKYLSSEEIFQALRDFDYSYAIFLLLLSPGYLFLKAWRFVLLLQPLERKLAWWPVFKAYIAGEAASFVPGGIAARAGLLKQAGIPLREGSIPVLFSSVQDQVVLITGALIVALWFERGRLPVLIILGVIAVIAILLAIPTTRRPITRATEWGAGKFNLRDEWRESLKNIPEVITWSTMSTTLMLTMASFALHIVMLQLAIEGVGISPSYSVVALAYLLPTVLGRLSGSPGGVGVTEAAMVGFLTSTSELNYASGFAAVAIFRIAAVVFIGLFSVAVYFLTWNGEQETANVTSS